MLLAHTMFSPWWIPTAESRPTPALCDNPSTLSNYPRRSACTSFRLSASKGTPLPQLRNSDPPQLMREAASSSSSLVDDSTSGSESTRPLTRGEYCKVVNLRIPLPSCRPSGREGLGKGGGAGGGAKSSSRWNLCQQAERNHKTSTPKLKQLEFVAFGEDLPSPDRAPQSKPSTSQLGLPSTADTLHTSSFLASLMQHRELNSDVYAATSNGKVPARKDHSLSPSPSLNSPGGLPRRPHPSTVYPDLSLSSMKLHACTPPATPTKGVADQPASAADEHDCFFRYSHRGREGYSEGLEHLTNARLVPPPLLVGSSRHPRPGYSKSSLGHSQHCTELPPLSSASPAKKMRVMRPPVVCEVAPLQAQGHSVAKHTHHRAGLPGLAALGCLKPHQRENQACFPDVFAGAPPAFHKRLVQMAGLVSETIRWEKTRRFRKAKNNGGSGQGSA